MCAISGQYLDGDRLAWFSMVKTDWNLSCPRFPWLPMGKALAGSYGNGDVSRMGLRRWDGPTEAQKSAREKREKKREIKY